MTPDKGVLAERMDLSRHLKHLEGIWHQITLLRGYGKLKSLMTLATRETYSMVVCEHDILAQQVRSRPCRRTRPESGFKELQREAAVAMKSAENQKDVLV